MSVTLLWVYGCRDLCAGFLMVCLWWLAFLSAGRWDLTVLDLLVWKSKEGSFTSLIGSLALHWTSFSYVWDSSLATRNFMLSVQFHVSFWPAQKCRIMMFTLGCTTVSIIKANKQTTKKIPSVLFKLGNATCLFPYLPFPNCHSQI